LMLDIDGVLKEEGSHFLMFSEEPATSLVMKKLNKAADNEDIKAVILRVNSPGGTVTATDIIWNEIRSYKAAHKVPVVAMLMGTAASGGYYVACAADRIYAHPTTITGSIGVMVFSFGFDGLFQKIGLESRVVKSEPYKDMGNPFDQFTDDEKKIFQGIVDQYHKRFIQVVADGRPGLNEQDVEKLTDGRIFTAQEALDRKLIDRIGYMNDAIDEAMRLANIRDAKVIMYSTSWRENTNIYSVKTDSVSPGFGFTDKLASSLIEQSRPSFLYMWLGQ